VGTYAIAASGASASNFSISYVTGNLTVTPAPLKITADYKTRLYGAANPTLTATYSGLVNGDSVNNLTTQPTFTTIAVPASHSGSYAIQAVGAASANYTISYQAGALTVTPAPLMVMANDSTKVYGQANPPFLARNDGFVLGENASALGGTLGFNTTASAGYHVGSYPITPSGLTSGNYAISYLNGELAVTPAPLVISANDQIQPDVAPLPALVASKYRVRQRRHANEPKRPRGA
jgi:hypothetical protein